MSIAKLMVFGVLSTMTLAPGVAGAQGKGAAEVGFDFGLNAQIIDDIDETDITFGIPNQDFGSIGFLSLQTIRVGFFLTDSVQLEPTLGFSSAESDEETLWQLGLGLDAIVNFGASDASSRPFLGGGAVFRTVNVADESASQAGLGAGGGVKLRVGERTAIRLEARGSRWFENDDFLGHWDLGASVGFSVFTK